MSAIEQAMRQRVLLKDGGMGWLLMRGQSEDAVLRAYVAAGADILTANTFMPGTDIAGAVSRARKAAGCERFVAGSVGPTCKSNHIAELLTCGVDALMIETICNPGHLSILDSVATAEVPLMLSATIGADGKLPCGATIREFAEVALRYNPLTIGLNCGDNPATLIRAFRQLDTLPCMKTLHPSAGLPGRYVTPEEFAATMRPLIARKEVNIIGGCCGIGPEHIRALNFLR